MIDVRCKNCNRLLMKAVSVVAAVKCPSCKMIFEYKLSSSLHVNQQYDKIETESKRPDTKTVSR